MSFARTAVSILAIATLMVIHEAGHYFPARYFGMRVVRFSIGFGPTLFKHQKDGNSTIFQISVIPFLAYVQIAGMNPFEENDPNDKSLYSNASLWARIVTIFGGPLANYLTASVFIFLGYLIAGKTEFDDKSMKVMLGETESGEVTPAIAAGFSQGDRVLSVDGKSVRNWEDLRSYTGCHPGEKLDFLVDRDGKETHLFPIPTNEGPYKGTIRIRAFQYDRNVALGEAAVLAVKEPAFIVAGLVQGLSRLVTGKEKANFSGPVGIVKETNKAAKEGPGKLLQFVGMLSALIGAFNLVPTPALDGGRLMFLGYEAVARRKPDPKVEAYVHGIGMMLMLTMMVFVTWGDITKKDGPVILPPICT